MYSVVLMMALSNGGAAPAHDARFQPATHATGHYAFRGGRRGCCGCSYGGCYGYSCCGCYGSSYAGCYGYSCCGCYGSSYGGCCGNDDHSGGGTYPGDGTYPRGGGARQSTPRRASANAVPGTILVSLPAQAVLTVDGEKLAKTDTETRTLVTPALPRTGEYHYVLAAEIVRDGEKLTESKRVLVRPGETTEVSFAFLAASARK